MIKNFRLNIIIRIGFLGFFIFALFYSWQLTNSVLYSLLITICIIYSITSLIHYVEKSNRDLARFLDSIQYEDFSQSFSSRGMGYSFRELSHAFNRVIKDFNRIRSEKEEQFHYLKTIVQHVGIGLIVFQENGRVELINRAAKKILGAGEIKNLNRLKPFSADLVNTLLELKIGENILQKIYSKNTVLQLSLYSTRFKLKNKDVTLVSIHDIQSELEENELEAWQKLIRVLTHEILNSMTPIISLSSTATDLLSHLKEGNKIDKKSLDELNDSQNAVQTIQKRSEGLLHFVEAFRRIYRLPQPTFEVFPAKELIDRVYQLMHNELEQHGIKFSFQINPKDLQLTADVEMIEQVLINLTKNALQALKGISNPQVEITTGLNERGRAQILVHDNGPGIPEEIQEQIFIPFFTTKEDGSGIGLSLSRQILRLHRGNIFVTSRADSGTTFSLSF